MTSKYVDSIAITQVIGCVYNSPQLLDFTDKYTITEEDFPDTFHQVVFGAIYKIHELGAEKITLENILDFLSTRPKYEGIFNANKGEEWLLKVSENAKPLSFDYYYARLKKFSLLRAYDKFGIDISFIYDPDNILDAEKKQAQEEELDNSTLEHLAQLVDDKIEQIKYEYVNAVEGASVQAGDGIFKLIDNLKEHPEVGSPLYGPLVNTITRGARLRKFMLRSAATGMGKAIPNDTIIPTPSGWRQVGDIQPGDYIFSQEGKPTKVLQIFPQLEKKDVYEITFNDGRKAKCCEDHLWDVYYGKRNTHKVLSLKEIYQDVKKTGYQYASSGEFKYKIILNQAVEYPKKEFKCPPYVLGALLGDGCLIEAPTNHQVLFSSADPEVISEIEKETGWFGMKRPGNNYTWIFREDKNDKMTGIWTKKLFSDYPELINSRSENKFIPKDYFLGSIQQRYDLLNGLLDTDGTVDKSGRRISYGSICQQLRDDVKLLCDSLGIFATPWETSEGMYGIEICPKDFQRLLLFRLPRKKNRMLNNTTNYRSYKFIRIVSIEKLDYKADMTCFTVDAQDHLFLMNDYLVTHNTRSMIADACYLACDHYYHEQFGWITNGVKEPVFYITTEQDKNEIQTMMLAFLSNVNEEHILNGEYLEGEEDRVKRAAKELSEAPLYIRELPDFSLQDIENEIKKAIRDMDAKYIVLDYIHTSMKILEEITQRSGGVKLREDNILFMLSNKLKDICNNYGVFILSGTQLNGSYIEGEVFDQNLLRGRM